MVMILKCDLQLRRDLQNTNFQNWRLGHSSGRRAELGLPHGVARASAGAVDYLHTRASVLRNHLLYSLGRLFVVTCGPAASTHAMEVHEVSQADALSGTARIHTVAGLCTLSSPEAVPMGPGVPVDPSLAVVASCSAPTPTPASTTENLSATFSDIVLASMGRGDLTLVVPGGLGSTTGNSTYLRSSTVFPLRAPLPLQYCRPFNLESAAFLPSGDICCIVSEVVVKGESGRPGSHESVSHCETHAITLSARLLQPSSTSPGQPQAHLEVLATAPLSRSALAPHLVLPNTGSGAVVLGLDPESAAAHVRAADVEQGAEADVEHVDCRRRAVASQGTAYSTSMDDDDDDVDPCTLAEAAARLAQYTSEEPQGPLPPQQWADIYKESGPDGVGAMGSEPGLELLALPLPASGSPAAGPAHWHMSLGACKLLTAESAQQGLLGVTDDVDCAVLQLSWVRGAAHPEVRHVGYIPALAYVAAGKVQRKHLLLGGAFQGSSDVAAVLVEAQKYFYVYRQVGAGQAHGQQELVDMQLQPGENVLGARLLDPPGPRSMGDARPVLLLLTERRLLLHVL